MDKQFWIVTLFLLVGGCVTRPAVTWQEDSPFCPYCRMPVAMQSTACSRCGKEYRWQPTVCSTCAGKGKRQCSTCASTGKRTKDCRNCLGGWIYQRKDRWGEWRRSSTFGIADPEYGQQLGRRMDDEYLESQRRRNPGVTFTKDPQEHVYGCPVCEGKQKYVITCDGCSGTGMSPCNGCDGKGKIGL